MSLLVSDRARRLWDEWNLRFAILVSLFFQVLLIVFANLRRTRRRTPLTAIIWSSYLLADWIAAFAVGLISSGQTNNCPEQYAVNKQLAAFWAPFLLLHLGGPDAITAFSLEDNELWIRHLLGVLIQLVAVVYVFLQSLPNEYWIPTVLMFLAGACKYTERTCALYRACLGTFKRSQHLEPDPGSNYNQLLEQYTVFKASEVPVKIETVKEPEKISDGIKSKRHLRVLNYQEIVINGYNFFNTFKGLLVDRMFSSRERYKSRNFFFHSTASDAFKIMEVELNFMYDALYTKNALMHCKIGYLCRFLCTSFMVACFQQFASHPQRNKIIPFDKNVTYVLLAGAVLLDLLGMFNLVFSDWAIVFAKQKVSAVLIGLPFGKRGCRWSNTMYQHSFISFCRKESFKWLNVLADFLNIKDTLDEFQYKKEITCTDHLKKFIFSELKAKAEKAQSIKIAKEIYSARGKWVLSDYTSLRSHPSILSSLSDDVEYDQSLLLWHIATELCYFTSSGCDQNSEFCKVLSDYMLYLLVMRPVLMSAVANIAQTRFQDTFEEAKKFFQRLPEKLSPPENDPEKPAAQEPLSVNKNKSACEMLLSMKTIVNPREVRGDSSKSLLFDACMLAKALNELDDNQKWEMMSRIWVELLSYAASHCRPSDHVRQLSQGGELITFVWLLMAHFGLGEQFRTDVPRRKLIVGK